MVVRFFLDVAQKAVSASRLQWVESKSKPSVSLQKLAEFLSLSKSGRRRFPSQWMIVNFKAHEQSELRVGITIPKFVGNAVTRNRFRRWLKQIIRIRQANAPVTGLEINFVFRRQGKDFYKTLEYHDVEKSVAKAFQQLHRHDHRQNRSRA